jgi:hypothetical protein
MTGYYCSACHASASIKHGALARGCACAAPVVCEMQAVATGEGACAVEPTPTERLFAAFHAIGLKTLELLRARV